jgi:hypothetical protein
VWAIASRLFFLRRRIHVSLPRADMRFDTALMLLLGVAAMTLPEPTAPALASAYHGLHLVPQSAPRSLPESATVSANLLYRVAAIGAALFLVVTLF